MLCQLLSTFVGVIYGLNKGAALKIYHKGYILTNFSEFLIITVNIVIARLRQAFHLNFFKYNTVHLFLFFLFYLHANSTENDIYVIVNKVVFHLHFELKLYTFW